LSSSKAAWGSGDETEQEARRRLAVRSHGKNIVCGAFIANL
jgi:hypothetical protein